jgi:hypothetical protein
MELSLLCGIKILLTIIDKNNKVTILSPDQDIRSFIDNYLKKPEDAKELFFNEDVNKNFPKKLNLN